jgi:hypothetical protein
MSLTSAEIKIAREHVNEAMAISVGSLPTQFGVISNQDDLIRAFEIPTADNTALYTKALDEYGSFPADFYEEPTSGIGVINPIVNGETIEGTYRHVYSRFYTIDDRKTGTKKYLIVQILRRGFVQSVDAGVLAGEDATGVVSFEEFILAKEVRRYGPHELPILQLRGVDPSHVREICENLNVDTHTDIEYAHGTMTGTWSRVEVVNEVQEDGTHNILITLHDNRDAEELLVGRKETSEYREWTYLYQRVPEPNVSAQVEALVAETGYIFVSSDARKTTSEGIWDIYVVLRQINTDDTGYMITGYKETVDYTEETRRYISVDSTTAETLVQDATYNGYILIDSNAVKAGADGVFDVIVVLRSFKNEIGPTLVGRRETEYYIEKTYLYQNVKAGDVENTVKLAVYENAEVLLAGSRAVPSSAGGGSFDVTVTTRESKVGSGGEHILIGATGGLFRTLTYLHRNIPDDRIEDRVAAWSNNSLYTSIRASMNSATGLWDMMYTTLEIPPASVEGSATIERRTVAGQVSAYNVKTVYAREITGVSIDSSETPAVYTPDSPQYFSYKRRLPQSFYTEEENMDRLVKITKTVSYSVNPPTVSNPLFSNGQSTGGEVRQLTNGAWKEVIENIEYDWWPAPTMTNIDAE